VRAVARVSIRLVVYMKVTGLIIGCMVRGGTSGLMVECMKETSTRISDMERECIYLLTGKSMMEIGIRTREKATAS